MVRMTLVLVLLWCSYLCCQAQAKHLVTAEDFWKLKRISDPRISPEGSMIVYQLSDLNEMTDKSETTLRLIHSDGSGDRLFAKGNNAEWSPDGSKIAFRAPDEHGNTQIFVQSIIETAQPRQITNGSNWPSKIHWSPDGMWIGFAGWIEKQQPELLPFPMVKPQGGKWKEGPHFVDRLHYHVDGSGYVDGGTTHLFVVSASGGQPKQITSGAWSVGFWWDGLEDVTWSWSPDGKTIVFDGYPSTEADLHYEECYINAVDVATGQLRRLTSERGLWSIPSVSPDGRWVAFNGFPAKTESYHTRELYVVRLDGSGLKKLSGKLDRDISAITWSPESDKVYFEVQDRGNQNVYAADLSGKVTATTTGTHVLGLGNVARNGTAVVTQTSLFQPAEIATIEVHANSGTRQVTHLNDDLLKQIGFGDIEEIGFPSRDGVQIQGWLYKPPRFDDQKKYPLILAIHGGPVIMGDTRFNIRCQLYASLGYLVLYVNPRSGSGYGTQWTNTVSFNMPGLDYEDLMAGVDNVQSRGYVDKERLFVTGKSYGGTLTAWTVGHTKRFAAAAVLSPNADWISWSATSDLPLSAGGFFFRKPFWEDPSEWLAHSPLMYFGNVTTPTLIMNGESDLRTPIGQSEELFVALKKRGVPTLLVRFPNDSHLELPPSHVMREILYPVAWFERFGAKAPSDAAN